MSEVPGKDAAILVAGARGMVGSALVRGKAVSMRSLTDALESVPDVGGRVVVDETGLTGGYDFWIDWTPEETSETGNSETGGTFREALKNQLGLKLEPAKGPVQVLVIDHVEQPTAN